MTRSRHVPCENPTPFGQMYASDPRQVGIFERAFHERPSPSVGELVGRLYMGSDRSAAIAPTRSDQEAKTMSDESTFEPHPLAGLFPPMGRHEYEELKADIRRRGLQVPIVLHEGRILDGRNRYLACKELGIPPSFINYEGDDPVGFVASMNCHRRHLNRSQLAMIAARLADSKPGGDRSKPHNCGLSHGRVATQFGVSKRLVDMASALLNAVASGQGRELAEQVFIGEMALNKAMRLLKLAQLGGSSVRTRQSRRLHAIVLQAERLRHQTDLLVADMEKTTVPCSEIRMLLAQVCHQEAGYFDEQAERLRGSELLLLPVEDA
jgi:hypothetical protein